MADRPDETWHRLLRWTYGQTPSERLSGHVLVDAGYEDFDPSHPLGGPDQRKDALAIKDGQPWIMAVYFPRDQQPFSAIKTKFLQDHEGVARHNATGMAFVTNQELSLGERQDLKDAVGTPVEIFHLERVAHILDKPAMHAIREQYLMIDAPRATPAPAPQEPSVRELLDAAVPPPGAGRRNSIYDGMLVLRVVVAPAPAGARHPDASNPRATLVAASALAAETAAEWPDGVSLLAKRLGEGWTPMTAHEWGAGRSSEDPTALSHHNFAAASFTTVDSVVCVDRTWATSVYDDNSTFAYYAAREPQIAAELLVSLRLAAELLEFPPGLVGVDAAVHIAAAPTLLVASDRAGGPRFEEPAGYITPPPPAEVRCNYHDSGRFRLNDLKDPYRAAEQLLGPWLATFREDDLLGKLRGGT